MLDRQLPVEFSQVLQRKDQALIELYLDLRVFVLELHPDANELLYHTHALTSVYSISEKLGDAFCMIPIYTAHLNLGFNKGTLLKDPHKLLHGTGNLIRLIGKDGQWFTSANSISLWLKPSLLFPGRAAEAFPARQFLQPSREQ